MDAEWPRRVQPECPRQCPVRVLGQSAAVSSPCPSQCPRIVRAMAALMAAKVLAQSTRPAIASSVKCPQTRSVHVRVQSTSAHSPSPWSVRVQSVAVTSPWTDRDRDLSMSLPEAHRTASTRCLNNECISFEKGLRDDTEEIPRRDRPAFPAAGSTGLQTERSFLPARVGGRICGGGCSKPL